MGYLQDPVVLFEDNHLLVLSKPPRMPVAPDSSGDLSLLEWARSYIKESRSKPGRAFVALVHRLDRPVSGIVCMALTSKAASRLSNQWREKRVTKRYLAVVSPAVKESSEEKGPILETSRLLKAGYGNDVTFKTWMIKDRRRNIASKACGNVKGARLAVTTARLVSECDALYLVELSPRTGRPHQLRLQLSLLGLPIIGDVKYGAVKPLAGGEVALHAQLLRINHPIRRQDMEFISTPPERWPWQPFGAILRQGIGSD